MVRLNLVTALLLIVSITVAQAEQPAPELLSAALAYDFSPAIATGEFIPFQRNEEHDQLPLLMAPPTLSGSLGPYKLSPGVPQRELTPTEARYMGRWMTGGTGSTLTRTLALLTGFYESHDRLPVNGLELFPKLRTAEGLESLLGLTLSEAAERYGAGVNILTGRFHETFSAADWSAGAINVAEVLTGAEIEQRFGSALPVVLGNEVNMKTGEFTMRTKDAQLMLLVSVWGEQPGTVLHISRELR